MSLFIVFIVIDPPEKWVDIMGILMCKMITYLSPILFNEYEDFNEYEEVIFLYGRIIYDDILVFMDGKVAIPVSGLKESQWLSTAQLSPPSGTAIACCFHIANDYIDSVWFFVFNFLTCSYSAAPQRVYRGAKPGTCPWWLGPPGPHPGAVHERYQGPGSGGLKGSIMGFLDCYSTTWLLGNLDNVVIFMYDKMGDGCIWKNRPSSCDISYP